MDAAYSTMLPPLRSFPGRALAREILVYCSDSQFHIVRDIATALDVDMDRVNKRCYDIMRQGSYHTFGERRRAAQSAGRWAYRFVHGGKKLDVIAFVTEVEPILDDTETLLNGHNVDYSKEAIKLAVTELRKVIDRMAR